MVNKQFRNYIKSLCLVMAFSVAATPAATLTAVAEETTEAAPAQSEKAEEKPAQEKKETEAPKQEEKKEEAPKQEEAPKAEEKKEEAPKQEEKPAEEKKEEPKAEQPAQEQSEQATEAEKQTEQSTEQPSTEEVKPAESKKADDGSGQNGESGNEGGQNASSNSGSANTKSTEYKVGEEFSVTLSDLKASDTKKAVFTVTAPSILEVSDTGNWSANDGVSVDVKKDGNRIVITATRDEAGEIALAETAVKFKAVEAGSGEISVRPAAYNDKDEAVEGEEAKIAITVAGQTDISAKVEAARAPKTPDLSQNVTDTYNFTYESGADSSDIHMDIDANMDIQNMTVSLPAGSSIKVTNSAGEVREIPAESITSEPIDLSDFTNETAIDITTGEAREGEKASVKITASILGKKTASIETKAKLSVKSGDSTASYEEKLSSPVTRCTVDTPTVSHGDNVVEFKAKAKIVLGGILVSSTENIGAYSLKVELPSFVKTETMTLPVLSSGSTINVSVLDRNGEQRSLGAFDGGSEVEIKDNISGVVLTVSSPSNEFEGVTPGSIILKNDDKDNKETYFGVKATATYTHDGKEGTAESTLDGITFVNYSEPEEPTPVPTPVVDPEAEKAEAERRRAEEERIAKEKEEAQLAAKIAANDQAAEENETLAKRRAIISDRLAQIKAGAVAGGLAGGISGSSAKKAGALSGDVQARLVTKDLEKLAKEKGIYPISDEIVEFNVRTQTAMRKNLSNRSGIVAISDRNVNTDAEDITLIQTNALEGATAEDINEETLHGDDSRS